MDSTKEGVTIQRSLHIRERYKNIPFMIMCVTLYLVLYVMIFLITTVEAHASLLEMEPAENVVADDPPSELILRFNEPIEHDLAIVTIYDSDAKPVFTGNPHNDVDKSPKLEFDLPKLDDGTYIVKWNVVSADGHPVGDSYAFSIGMPTEGGVKSVAKVADSEGALIVARVITEGLLLIGAGLFWFSWLAESRAFPSIDTLWKRGRRIGAIAIVLGTIAELITYSLNLPPGIIQVMLNGRWDLLSQFPFIFMVFAQLLFLLLLFIPGMVRGWYLALWLVLAITPAFGGHVWSMESPFIALIPRVIHQMVIAFWLGALAYVILLIISRKHHDKEIAWQKFRAFFMRKMVIASGLVIASGIVMVLLQTGITAIFTDWKNWSLLIIIKVVLTSAMISMAIYQTLKWKKTETFTTKRMIKVEWIVGLIVIALGVWISQISYPIAIKTYDETLTANQAEASVSIDQLKVGDQEMTVVLSERDGSEPDTVTVEVSMPQHDMGSGKVTVEPDENGHYTIDLPFTMPGTWLLEIHAIYPDGEEEEWQDELFIAGEAN